MLVGLLLFSLLLWFTTILLLQKSFVASIATIQGWTTLGIRLRTMLAAAGAAGIGITPGVVAVVGAARLRCEDAPAAAAAVEAGVVAAAAAAAAIVTKARAQAAAIDVRTMNGTTNKDPNVTKIAIAARRRGG